MKKNNLQKLNRQEAEKTLQSKYVSFVKGQKKEKDNSPKSYRYLTPEQAAKILTANKKDARDLLKLVEEMRHFLY